jgi:subtilisin family serine protease
MRKVYFYIMLLVLANSIYAQFNDPLLSTQNNLFAIEVPTVWQNRTIGENNIVVAVFGMGVDISHPDLNDNIFINTDEIPSNGLDDDNNGYVDDINGWNFYDNNSNILPYVLNDDNSRLSRTIPRQ